MLNLNSFVKLTADDVVWYTGEDGEPHWKPKNPEQGKTYLLELPKLNGNVFTTKPLLWSLRDSQGERTP